MKKIIEYFSKSTAKTLTLLLIVLGVSSLSFLSLPIPHKELTQRIAEDSSCTPCRGYYEEGICLNRWQIRAEMPACVGKEYESPDVRLIHGEDCVNIDEWCYIVEASDSSTQPDDGSGTESPPPGAITGEPIPTYGPPPGGGNEPTAYPTDTYNPNPTNPPRGGMNTEIEELVKIINNHRSQKELSTLKISATLTEAAQWMANDVADSGSRSHTDSKGRTPQKRLSDFGYNHDGGENIAISESKAQQVFEAWLDSPDHKRNLEQKAWKAIGAGRAQGENGWVWVTNFGAVFDTSEKSKNSCTEEDMSDSGEFDNECEEILKCNSEDERAGLCLCDQNQQCASNICLPTNREDGKRFCEEGPAPTDEEEENNSETPGELQEITVNLTVKVPGVGTNTAAGQNNNPKRKTRGLLFQFLNENDEIVYEAEDLLTYNNGVYTATVTVELPEGEYSLEIATDNSLFLTVPRVIAVSENANSYTIPTVNLITGNIAQNGNSENVLDIFDYNALLSCYGGKSCSTPGISDLNEDGKVDNLDFNIMLRGFAIQ